MGAGFFSAIVNGLLQAAFKAFSDFMERRGLINQGRNEQAQIETAATGQAQERMVQAASDAPHSRGETLTALDGGKF